MSLQTFDTVIIGSGPAGEAAAMRLSKAGQSVAIIEAAPQAGGNCTHLGTIPSKALRHQIKTLQELRRNPLFGQQLSQLHVDYSQLLSSANEVIQAQVATRYDYFQRNRVAYIEGWARFLDDHEIAVDISNNGDGNGDSAGNPPQTLRFEHAVIATGSRPYHPDDVDFSHPRVRDADTILDLPQSPKSITIYGAGVIGCEYASIFCNLGCKVNLVNTRDRLLSFLDDEITDALSYHLRDQGVVIRHQEEYASVQADDEAVTMHCQSGKQFRSEYLLWANGRSGNAASLGLEPLGIAVNHREQIVVDEAFRTAQPHIYAVGDVIGPPGLASASYDQGRYVGNLVALGKSQWQLNADFPTGIYTSPEISSVGKTEAQLTEEKVPYEVAHTAFKSIARAQITGRTVGVLKILFHRETLAILGIHCFGDNAAEIIHIGQAIMDQKGEANTLRYFAETTFNYPTMAEAYRVAALNGLNRVGKGE